MDWNVVSALAGVSAALSVAVSVVYLALEVKSGSQATRSQTYYMATSALAEMAALIGQDKRVARVMRVGLVTPNLLDEDETVQLGYLLVTFLRRYENVYFQYESGLIDDDFWEGHQENLLWVFRQPGMQSIWHYRRHSFSKRFREYLERSDDIELATPDSRRL